MNRWHGWVVQKRGRMQMGVQIDGTDGWCRRIVQDSTGWIDGPENNLHAKPGFGHY
jgi:hypothetical protein